MTQQQIEEATRQYEQAQKQKEDFAKQFQQHTRKVYDLFLHAYLMASYDLVGVDEYQLNNKLMRFCYETGLIKNIWGEPIK